MEKISQPPVTARRLPAWRLIGLLIPLALISYVISYTVAVQPSTTHGPWERAFDSMVSPSTARAMERDNILRRNIITFIDFSADASAWLAEKYQLEELKRTSEVLNNRRRELSITKSEPGLESLVKSLKEPRQLPNPLSGLGDLLKNGLSGITDSILGDLAGAGMFLGIGIGEGAASGLNFSTIVNAKAVGDRVAVANGMKSTGLNPAIRNIGDGLTGTLLGSVNVGSLASGVSIGPIVMGLATGLGNGAVSGLKIKAVAPPNTNSTSVSDIASMFGFGLTSSVTGALDLKSLTNTAISPQIMQQIPVAALGLAQGLGNGVVSGLKINSPAPPTGTGISDIAGAFGFGLTQSVTSNVNISQIGSQLGSGVDTAKLIMKYLPPAAAGFGKGLGQGIPIGLGAQPDTEVPIQTMPNGSIDVSGVAQSFAMGLTSRFLANGTATKLLAQNTGAGGLTSFLPNLDIGKAAGGFARGLIQGVGDGITAMGGLPAIINGSAITPTGPIPETLVDFDDTINRTAIGFAQGFGTQIALVAKAIVGQINTVKKRSNKPETTTDLESNDFRAIQARQSNVAISNITNVFNLSTITSLLNADAISGILQKGIELITCDGVGGLGLIVLGLIDSGALPTDVTAANLTTFKDLLPPGIIHFTNKGNTYEVDTNKAFDGLSKGLLAAAGGINVNGNKLGAFIAFLVIHIIFGIVVMLNIVPAALSLQSTRNILDRVSKPHILPWIQKWSQIMWIYIVTPSLAVIFIFGVVAMGNATHFRTPHGVLGLLTTIDGFAAVYLNVNAKPPPAKSNSFRHSPQTTTMQKVNTYNNQVFLLLIVAASLTGFADVSKIAICMTHILSFETSLALGFSLSMLVTVASAVTGVDALIEFIDARNAKKGRRGVVEGARGTRTVIEGGMEKAERKRVGKAGTFV